MLVEFSHIPLLTEIVLIGETDQVLPLTGILEDQVLVDEVALRMVVGMATNLIFL
jgi:hypothetical protein